jgi:phage tail sheath protein FI
VCLRIVSGLWQQGGLKGTAPTEAFYVLCDGTINTPSVVAAGEVRVQVGVALQYPAEFVTITLTQFDGGASVTDTASTF